SSSVGRFDNFTLAGNKYRTVFFRDCIITNITIWAFCLPGCTTIFGNQNLTKQAYYIAVTGTGKFYLHHFTAKIIYFLLTPCLTAICCFKNHVITNAKSKQCIHKINGGDFYLFSWCKNIPPGFST